MQNDTVSPLLHHHQPHNHNQHHNNNNNNNNHQHRKRRPRQPFSIKPQPGHVSFRIVCHVSIIGGLIGPNGSVIGHLRRDTGCKIHCVEAAANSEHRIVLVVGSGSIDKTIVLHVDNIERVECDVSCAQEAVIRVFERIWAVEEENNGGCGGGGEEVYCGLLVDTTLIGLVVGRGGKTIMSMRRETGAKIRILPPPHFAAKDDELIQITGGTLAVKKALVAVSSCLQHCPPVEKDSTLHVRPVETACHETSPDPHAEFFPNLSALLPPPSGDFVNHASNAHSLSRNADRVSSPDTQGTHQEVAFRLLCSNAAAGGIIGKRGSIVRALQNETGASIKFAAPLTGSGERVVTISALENLESRYSPAQEAVVLVFARSVESNIERGLPSGSSKGTTVTARFLVASDIVGCLSGNGGWIISEMIDVTGADIQILEEGQILTCGLENDVVVQITGEFINVKNALFQVTGRLRNNLLPSEVLNEVRERSLYGRVREGGTSPRLHQSLAISPDSNQETTLTREMDHLGLSNNIGVPPSATLQLPQNTGRGHIAAIERGSTTLGGRLEIERSLDCLLPSEVLNKVGARSPNGLVTKTTSFGLHHSLGLSPESDQAAILTRGKDQVGLSDNMGSPPSLRLQLPQTAGRGHKTDINGLTTFGGDLELESGMESSVGTKTTVEIVVAKHVLGSVYGEDGGNNLARLRQISGAKVKVRPCPGKSERMVVLSGTSDQVRVAQSLLQAFILSGQ